MTKPIIAYISQKLPNLTETFVYREIFALNKRGVKVIPFSIHAPTPEQLPDEVQQLAQETTSVFPLNWHRFLTAHLYFLLTKPLQYLKTLLFVMSRPNESKSNRQRTLYHFAEAIYLSAQAQRDGVQHIHAHFCVNAATIALVMARLLNISFSFTVHNNLFTDRIILPAKLREAKFVAVISEYSRDYLIKLLPHEPHLKQKYHIIHCGIPVEQFEPPPKRVTQTPTIILSVAQLVERKGMPVLIEACHILHKRGILFQCLIAGDGVQRPYLEQLIQDYQLQHNITLLGVVFQDKLQTYLNQTDIFAMACLTTPAGDRDGIPVALMEAMAMAIPTISTTVSGIPELIHHEQSGLLVPEQSAVALADALQHCIEDKSLRARLGQHGRQKVLSAFNINKTSEQMASLLINQL